MNGQNRPLYLGAMFWGAEFRRYFCEFCLPSLLAAGNLPSWRGLEGSKFLICTTDADWAAMSDLPVFKRLAELVTPVHLPFDGPAEGEIKMLSMSRGHRQIAERMFADRAFGMFVYPDTVFSDGVIARSQELAGQGKKVVLAFCPRFANEGFLAALEAGGYIGNGVPISLGPRRLLDMTRGNMHSETRTYDFESSWFSLRPVMCFWSVPDGSGYVFHSTNWAPVLVDYAELADHDVSTLEQWTIDGDYIYRNFPDVADIHVAVDTDEMALISFTPEASLTYLPLVPQRIQRLPVLGKWFRTLALRSFLHSLEIDPQKRTIFPNPVRVRWADGDASAWRRTEETSCRISAMAAAEPLSVWERKSFVALRILNEGVGKHLGYWMANRRGR